jgi:macrolide transport system ATP-binding/permease protein
MLSRPPSTIARGTITNGNTIRKSSLLACESSSRCSPLAIACVGLYATMSYGVARRTSEIGVRMALGARRATVVWMVLREVLTLAAIALAVSVPVALAASRLVESFLFGMKRNDPLALAAGVLTMVGAMLLAGYLPARNASRIDPMTALRHE